MTTPTRIARRHPDELIIGLVSISDRASAGAYQDQGLPAPVSYTHLTLPTNREV